MGLDQALTTFRDLLRPTGNPSPGEAQQRASEQLPMTVAASRMNWWQPGDEVRATGKRVLIGVAVWSGYDLRLLDYVDRALGDPRFADVTVDVFDCDRVRSPEEFEAYIPGLAPISGTPVVGLWNDGKLMDRAFGYQGRKIVADLFGFDMQELVARSTVAIQR
jgi:hypothetical protein